MKELHSHIAHFLILWSMSDSFLLVLVNGLWSAVDEWLLTYPDYDIDVIFCCFSDEAYEEYLKLDTKMYDELKANA